MLENRKLVTATYSNNSISMGTRMPTASVGTWAVLDAVRENTPMRTFTLAHSANQPNTTPSPKNVFIPLSHVSTPYNANSWDFFLPIQT